MIWLLLLIFYYQGLPSLLMVADLNKRLPAIRLTGSTTTVNVTNLKTTKSYTRAKNIYF
jgi:hypothetical protein